jgi:CheY-like chemotaxis protein
VKITDGMLLRVGEREPKPVPAEPAEPGHVAVTGADAAPVAEEVGEVALAEGIPIHNPRGPRELVLVVDDEEYVSLLAQRVLTEEGYRVITARDGLQALGYYKAIGREIALVILDFTLPMMDGAEVFEELLAIDPNVSVVLSSGFAEQSRVEAMLRRGLSGFLPKPYTHDKLLRQVRTTLDARAMKRQA